MLLEEQAEPSVYWGSCSQWFSKDYVNYYCSKITFPVLASTVPEKLFFHFSDSCKNSENKTRNYGEVLGFFIGTYFL